MAAPDVVTPAHGAPDGYAHGSRRATSAAARAWRRRWKA
jgi:hypothetical protein